MDIASFEGSLGITLTSAPTLLSDFHQDLATLSRRWISSWIQMFRFGVHTCVSDRLWTLDAPGHHLSLISHIHLKTWTKTCPFLFCRKFLGPVTLCMQPFIHSRLEAQNLQLEPLSAVAANSGVSTRQAAMQETCLQQTGYYYIEAPPGTYFVETFNFLWLSLQSSHFDRCCDAFFEGYNYFDVHLDNNLKNLNQLYRVALESALPIYQFNWTLRILRGVPIDHGHGQQEYQQISYFVVSGNATCMRQQHRLGLPPVQTWEVSAWTFWYILAVRLIYI